VRSSPEGYGEGFADAIMTVADMRFVDVARAGSRE
jgi:hypothetical protein